MERREYLVKINWFALNNSLPLRSGDVFGDVWGDCDIELGLFDISIEMFKEFNGLVAAGVCPNNKSFCKIFCPRHV